MNNIIKRYANKMIDPSLYGKITISCNGNTQTAINTLGSIICSNNSYVFAPYVVSQSIPESSKLIGPKSFIKSIVNQLNNIPFIYGVVGIKRRRKLRLTTNSIDIPGIKLLFHIRINAGIILTDGHKWFSVNECYDWGWHKTYPDNYKDIKLSLNDKDLINQAINNYINN